MELGRIGIWTFAFDQQPWAAVREAAAEIEALGYGAIWYGESAGRDALTQAALLLAATERIVVASGIARIGVRDARTMAAAHRALTDAYPDRFVLGLGGSRQLGTGEKPVAAMRRYLDEMDQAPYTPPPPRSVPVRMLGAMHPGMLRLAARRTDGTQTYLVPPAHTSVARAELGDGKVLTPEQAVALTTDRTRAHELGRAYLSFYLRIPAYTTNFKRIGFGDDDLANGGS
ncbi:MAG: hypothetical protein QOF51_572, partial [Chloroflexota bacterium]|nr:hypothetical protein [Chloroflexota bacterium]